jgi:hypothetical protein
MARRIWPSSSPGDHARRHELEDDGAATPTHLNPNLTPTPPHGTRTASRCNRNRNFYINNKCIEFVRKATRFVVVVTTITTNEYRAETSGCEKDATDTRGPPTACREMRLGNRRPAKTWRIVTAVIGWTAGARCTQPSSSHGCLRSSSLTRLVKSRLAALCGAFNYLQKLCCRLYMATDAAAALEADDDDDDDDV